MRHNPGYLHSRWVNDTRIHLCMHVYYPISGQDMQVASLVLTAACLKMMQKRPGDAVEADAEQPQCMSSIMIGGLSDKAVLGLRRGYRFQGLKVKGSVTDTMSGGRAIRNFASYFEA